MDDSTLFHPSKEYLENLKLINEKYLASRGMEYNSKKTKVFSIKEGFTFLGFKYRLTDTGKVIMTVSSEKVKERRRKLRKLVRKAKRGEFLSPYTPHGQILQEFMEWPRNGGN